MSSDDGPWEGLTLPSLSPTESAWKAQDSSPSFQTGRLSPVGSNIDFLVAGSSAPDLTNSAPSSCADGWSTGCGERDDVEDDSQWDPWELSSDEALVVPKLEPSDDHIDLDELKAAPSTLVCSNEAVGACEIKAKRPRGRPRKHPLGPVVNAAKVTKGRSKTGCITCRKRKKKCDEAKPICMNCEKNAVVCEGYHEKQVWKSGKERAEEERMICESFPAITMQPIFNGVETEEDKTLWKHYVNYFSNVLTVEGEAKNAFKDIILQLANRHQGLMHSILAVSSKHMDLGAPHKAKTLRDKTGTTKEALHRRGEYHHDEALRRLYEDMAKPLDKDDPEHQTVLAARYGQMLCLLLQTRADGNPRGEHRVHLQAYQKLIKHSPPEDVRLRTFITEFFQYHIYADDLLWHPETLTERLSSEDWEASEDIQPPRLLGVADGLFRHLSQITTIRNTIRSNMAASVDPLVDYTSLYKAAEIDTAIREWAPSWPRGDSRGRLALLYKQTMWVYLFRTIYPPSPFPSSSSSSIPAPTRRSTLASLPSWPPTASQPRRASMTATATGDTSGPPPARNSSMHDDVRITLAVDESLDILESFKPCDPAQTLLLIPCLLLGTSCFAPAQQQRVRAAVGTVRAYTGLKSCDRTLQLLDEVWRLMHSGDWVSVWDWQGVARRMGLDFPCA